MANWKYRINIKQFLTEEENLSKKQYKDIGKRIAKNVYSLINSLQGKEENSLIVNDLEEAYNMFLTSSSEEDINEALEYLYDIGDDYSIWIG